MFSSFPNRSKAAHPPLAVGAPPHAPETAQPSLGEPIQRTPQAASNPTQQKSKLETEAVSAWLTLKQRLHQMILESMNLALLEKVSASDLRREVASLVAGDLQANGPNLNADRMKLLVNELIDELMGLGPLEPLLADDTVSDILVNGPEHIFVERSGMLERSSARFMDERHLLRVIDKIVSKVGRQVNESQPMVDARLEDGSRVNAIIKPLAIDGASLSIRKFSVDKLTFDKLVAFGALSEQAADFLSAVVQARMNVLISGGTGSGKTTMLNALSSFIDPRQRIVTIEDAAELQLQQEHVVRLETRPPHIEGAGEITQRDLVKNALRMRPDRIVIGEVRGNEAFDMLQAMNTGHDGSMATIHANTARDAVSRLEQMVVMVGNDFPLSAVRQQVAAGLNIIVQLNRLSDGSRKVMSISEITGLEGSAVLMQDIFKFEKQGLDENGKIKGQFLATGVRPRCAEAIIASGIDLPISNFAAQARPQ